MYGNAADAIAAFDAMIDARSAVVLEAMRADGVDDAVIDAAREWLEANRPSAYEAALIEWLTFDRGATIH